MSNILITGGAGYIGSVLCGYLLDEGHNVTVLDNFNYCQNSLNSFYNNKKFNVEKIDIRDSARVNGYLKKNDIIIPLAALVGAPLCDLKKKEAEDVNLNSIIEMSKILSKNQYIIYPTTNSGYGIGNEGQFCTEETVLNPISLYGKTKASAENLISEKIENSTRFRLATVFGCSPRMRLDLLVNDFVYRAIKDKFIVLFEADFKRNYIHIRDVCRAFLYAINNHQSFKGETFNLGLSEANLSKKKLCEKIKSIVGSFEILISDIGEDIDKRNYIVSNDKIEKTGFKTVYSLDYGIRELEKLFKFLIPTNDMRNI